MTMQTRGFVVKNSLAAYSRDKRLSWDCCMKHQPNLRIPEAEMENIQAFILSIADLLATQLTRACMKKSRRRTGVLSDTHRSHGH